MNFVIFYINKCVKYFVLNSAYLTKYVTTDTVFNIFFQMQNRKILIIKLLNLKVDILVYMYYMDVYPFLFPSDYINITGKISQHFNAHHM